MSDSIGKLISIGIPAYNQGSYLKKTIESLLNQSIKPLEIVVSDNHSTDETSSVASEFGDKIRLIKPPKHMRMMEHWNFVVSQLNGEWFSLLSSDDIAKENFVLAMLNGIQSSKNAILVRSGYETIDESGKIIEKRFILTVNKVTKPPKTLYEQLLGPKVSFAAFAVKRKLWEKSGGFPESCSLIGDWGFWLKLSPFGDFVYEHGIVSQYRTNYRPGITKIRMLDCLRDDVAIYVDLIPKVLQDFQDIDRSKFYKASKLRCQRQIALASNIIDTSKDREYAIEILKEWAEQSDCIKQLEKFKVGEKLFHKDKTSYFKSIIRNIYQFSRSI